jgi:hypothetical protein
MTKKEASMSVHDHGQMRRHLVRKDEATTGQGCATPRCDNSVTNPQSGYCNSCLNFMELCDREDDARAQEEFDLSPIDQEYLTGRDD